MSVTLKVSGMTCKHCEMHVKDELTAAGASSVLVILNPEGTSIVKVEGNLSDDALADAIDEAGDYTLDAIER